MTSSATVTVQGWWHLDSGQPITDSSGNSRTFGSAYSTAPAAGGSVAAQVIINGAGGPLDSTGFTSTNCIRVGVGVGGKRQSSMWGLGYNPPAVNYGIEIWVLPQDNGIAGGTGGWIFSSGQSGGVAFRINAPSGNPSYIDAFDVQSGKTIGNQVPIDTNKWMHLALVNIAGATTFYTNGVACGTSVSNLSTPAGDCYMISAPGDNQAFDGYLDEARMFTFAAGAFSTNDLLLRPAGPNIIVPPQNAPVWVGGAAPFSVVPSFDNTLTYQWQRGGVNISGATNTSYTLPVVTTNDAGATFDLVVSSSSGTNTTPAATLTVWSPNAANVAAYRSLITSNTSLVEYFPVDNDTNTTVTNTVSAALNGTLVNDANYDGRTNRSFGQRAMAFDGNAVVQVPQNPAVEFPTGNGTIEGLVYMSQQMPQPGAIVSEGYDGGFPYYQLLADATGNNLIYSNNNATANTYLTWPVQGGMIGKLLHVALVISGGTNITPYVNGQSLGTQTQAGFGGDTGGSLWIGGIGASSSLDGFLGTIDELAVYNTALSSATIQLHYTKLVFGTNLVPPVIVSQPSSKSLLAGGSPSLSVSATGGLPFAYQWTSNGTAISGATSSTLVLSHTTTNSSGTYTLTITNVFGAATSQPVVLTFTAPPAGYVAQVMKDSPTAFWRLAEQSGTVAVDSAGLNDAIYTTNGVTYGAGGFPGDTNAGVKFNGSTGRAVTPANFPDINPNGPFSIEFWGRLNSYGFYVPIGSMDRPSRTGGYEFYIDGNAPGYEFHTAAAGGYNMLTGDNNVPPNGTWDHVVGIWDTTNLYIYVNGMLGNDQLDAPAPAGTDNYQTEGAPPFNPNTLAPFYIASRADNTHFYNGTLSDIAFYNYALSPSQITNHYSYGWVPSSITAITTNITAVEGSTVTISPTALGVPNTYTWYFKGSALFNTLNSDNSAHYPNDVTNSSLVISQTKPTDSGQYQLIIGNPLNNSTSAIVNVVITANTNPPTVVSVTGLGTVNTSSGASAKPNLVKVVFSNRIDPATGGNKANYSIAGLTITNVTLLGSGANDLTAGHIGADWREAILVTSGLTPGQQYTLVISGLKDQSQTPVSIPTSSTVFRAPVLTSGSLTWDYYYLGSSASSTVPALTGDPNYPNAPQTNGSFSVFDTDPLTGGDLNNNAAFGALGDHYGDVLSGWITPTVTGAYTFFISSDDSSELDLSMDANPADATMIANEPGCCHPFTEPTNTTPPTLTSLPVNLTQGQSYFIRALHVEGGGGDYVKVAWRISTDTTAAANLNPIPGAYLSSYQQAAPPQFATPVLSNGVLRVSWSSFNGTVQQSTNLINWTPVTGNPNPLIITPGPAQAEFFRIVQ
jgi:hypothetical protein